MATASLPNPPRIPSLSASATERAIARLLDAALAVPGAGADIDAAQHPPCDWGELLSNWIEVARRNDEDVRLVVRHYPSVPGQIHGFTTYQVRRNEGCVDRRLIAVDVSTVTVEQPTYTDCDNCGTCDHNGYRCPCGCHDGNRQ